MTESQIRRIHATGPDLRVVRYEPGGHWYVEATRSGGLRRYDTIKLNSEGKTARLNSFRRKRLTTPEAVDCALVNGLEHIEGVDGGGAFDRLMRLSKPVVADE